MLYTVSLPHSPAHSNGSLVLGEKPWIRTVNPVSQITLAEMLILSTDSRVAEVNDLSSFFHTKYTAQGKNNEEEKRQAGLQVHCCQYDQTEMQFNAASHC